MKLPAIQLECSFAVQFPYKEPWNLGFHQMCKYISWRKSSSDPWSYSNTTLVCFSQWMRCSKGCRADTHSSPHNSNVAPLAFLILISMEGQCSNVACVPKYNHTDVLYKNESEEITRCKPCILMWYFSLDECQYS